MSNVLQALRAVEDSLVARQIMTPVSELLCADDVQEAVQVSRTHGFEVVPRLHLGSIRDYWWATTTEHHVIELRRVVAGDTRVLDLLEFFESERFGFVLSGRRFAGLLHFSDLNKQPLKIAFYVQFEAVERTLRDRLRPRLEQGHELLDASLDAKDVQKILKRHRRDQRAGVDIGLINSLYNFGQLLKVAEAAELHALCLEDQVRLTKARNKLMHANEPLIQQHKDVAELIWLRDTLPSVG